jgi:5-methylthioadenosine/S-adenosylhomocysteine deaminase
MGTTHLHEIVLAEIARSGIRAVSGKAMMDHDPSGAAPVKLRESTGDSLDESERLAALVEERYAPRVKYGYAPRFALSATPELHREVARRARERGRWIHTHASETESEVAAVVKAMGEPCVRFLAREGVLDGRTTVAHAVHLEEGEREILAATKTGVAHCPTSNLKLGSGIADVPALRQAGIAVGLGSDGAACNNRLDPFREMALAALLPARRGTLTRLRAADAVKMATIEGARAIGLDAETGSLEAGKRADLVVLDFARLQTAAGGDPWTSIAFAASPANVRDVVCDGRIVKRDFRLTGFDEREVAVAAGEMRVRLFRRAGLA